MKNTGFRLYPILKPLSFLYGIGIRLRNLFFEWNILPSVRYSLPVICVGNLAVGGTGKTPVIEYLIRLLAGDYRIAVLSRGYKRKTKGFILANANSTSVEIGDEPYQIKLKYPDITVAVDSDRRHGMYHLLALPENQRPEVVLLDDGFQHRYVKPSLSIIVTDYNRIYYKDKLMPVGRLREPAKSMYRTNLVIVSKCPESLTPGESCLIENKMRLKPTQQTFFSRIDYLPMKRVFPQARTYNILDDLEKKEKILIVTGIANPDLLIKEIRKYNDNVYVLTFPDHHDFMEDDIIKIQEELQKMNTANPIIICTEKDAARFRNNVYLPGEWKLFLYYIPLVIDFLFDKGKEFDGLIRNHIETIINNNKLKK